MKKSSFDVLPEDLNRKIFAGIREGWITFSEHMNIEMTEKNIALALKMEEYEAAAKLRDHLENLKNESLNKG